MAMIICKDCGKEHNNKAQRSPSYACKHKLITLFFVFIGLSFFTGACSDPNKEACKQGDADACENSCNKGNVEACAMRVELLKNQVKQIDGAIESINDKEKCLSKCRFDPTSEAKDLCSDLAPGNIRKECEYSNNVNQCFKAKCPQSRNMEECVGELLKTYDNCVIKMCEAVCK